MFSGEAGREKGERKGNVKKKKGIKRGGLLSILCEGILC